jgi:glutaredoxin-like protein NrdH
MVLVYSKRNCVQCNATYRRLDEKGVEYRVIDMTEDASALEKVKSLGHLQAPVIVAPDGTHWSGFDPNKIDALAH